jgi:hypothetical protein
MKGTVLASLALFLFGSLATASTISASGEGWCDSSAFCNNNDTSDIANTLAGSNGTALLYRDWYAFRIPVGGVQGIINIWNNAQNTNTNGSAVYDLYGAGGISYADLFNGPILGSVALSTANTGVRHYVSITLNSEGLEFESAHQGGLAVFGGDVNGAAPGTTNEVFGFGEGDPVAILGRRVPEPASIMLVGTGWLGLAGMVRRKLRV